MCFSEFVRIKFVRCCVILLEVVHAIHSALAASVSIKIFRCTGTCLGVFVPHKFVNKSFSCGMSFQFLSRAIHFPLAASDALLMFCN